MDTANRPKTICAIDTDGSCSRRRIISTEKIPSILVPFDIHRLYFHISRVFQIAEAIKSEDFNDSFVYIHDFLVFFIYVKNYNQFEKLFKLEIETTKLMFFHMKMFGDHLTQILNEKKEYYDDVNPEENNHLDLLVATMQFIRVFSRLDELSEYFGTLGGINVIKKAMILFPNSIHLQINCSACLANLASTESNRKKMLEDGSIGDVLANMARVC
jgi:hypothetical protein